MNLTFEVEGGNFTKAGFASSELKKILKKLNVNTSIIKRTVVALYEAEVNIVAHAYNGIIDIQINNGRVSIKLTDQGPGIANIELAMTDGYSTASPEVRQMGFGAGLGLQNIKRNADVFHLESVVDEGTVLLIENKLT